MINNIKNHIQQLIQILNQFAAKINSFIAPAIRIGKIIAAVYSLYSLIVLIGCGIMGHPMRWLTGFPGCRFIFTAMMILSMITLVLSGCVADALKIILFGLDLGLSVSDIPSGTYSSGGLLIMTAICTVLFVLPLALSMVVVIFVPIVPILMHWSRTE